VREYGMARLMRGLQRGSIFVDFHSEMCCQSALLKVACLQCLQCRCSSEKVVASITYCSNAASGEARLLQWLGLRLRLSNM